MKTAKGVGSSGNISGFKGTLEDHHHLRHQYRRIVEGVGCAGGSDLSSTLFFKFSPP